METYTATITGFYTQFSTDDSVMPFVQITPIYDGKGFCVNQIPTILMHDNSDFMLAVGDTIDIQVTGMKFLIKVITPSATERVNLRITHCPVCHSKLVIANGMPFCTNINCRAHLKEHIYTMLNALGFKFDDINIRIIETVYSRLFIHSPVDLFTLTIENLRFAEISDIDAQHFIQCLHSIRGHVTFEQFFNALNVFGMTPQQVSALCDAMRYFNLDLNTVGLIFVINQFNLIMEYSIIIH